MPSAQTETLPSIYDVLPEYLLQRHGCRRTARLNYTFQCQPQPSSWPDLRVPADSGESFPYGDAGMGTPPLMKPGRMTCSGLRSEIRRAASAPVGASNENTSCYSLSPNGRRGLLKSATEFPPTCGAKARSTSPTSTSEEHRQPIKTSVLVFHREFTTTSCDGLPLSETVALHPQIRGRWPNDLPLSSVTYPMPSRTTLTAGELKRHICPYGSCGKRFSSPCALRAHFVVHSGATPFSCPHPGCGKKFNVISNMRRHFKSHSRPREQSNNQLDPPFDQPTSSTLE